MAGFMVDQVEQMRLEEEGTVRADRILNEKIDMRNILTEAAFRF